MKFEKTQKWSLSLILACSLAVVFGTTSVPASDKTGNGGDTCEIRIKDIRNDLSSWIQKNGAEGLKLPDNVCLNRYNREMLNAISVARVSCTEDTLSVGSAEKTCKNFVDSQGTTRIVCNIGRFMQQTSESDQYVLIHHEYAGIAGFEVNSGEDSDYVISNQLSGFLEDRMIKRLAIKPSQNSMGMTFVKINPGTFMMGSPDSEANRDGDEVRHQVTLTKSFEMQTTSVTQAQWVAIMKSNPSYFAKKENCPDTFILNPIAMCPNNPVEQVSWNDVQVYLLKLNMAKVSEGYFYRLPTEAEWEYSARAGTQTAYYFGDDASRLFAYGWYDATSGKQTQAVGQLKPNAWGLYDMSGNVWQWVSDTYGDYSKTSVTNPIGASSGSYRVIRGGSWYFFVQSLRSAYRTYYTPSFHFNFVGFRLSRTN